MTPTAVTIARKAGRIAIECAALLLTIVVLGTAVIGG